MPGKVTEENIKRFGGKKNADKYEAIKKSIDEKKKKANGGKKLTKRQEENSKEYAAKIVNSQRND